MFFLKQACTIFHYTQSILYFLDTQFYGIASRKTNLTKLTSPQVHGSFSVITGEVFLEAPFYRDFSTLLILSLTFSLTMKIALQWQSKGPRNRLTMIQMCASNFSVWLDQRQWVILTWPVFHFVTPLDIVRWWLLILNFMIIVKQPTE